jgi:hypothetical protein
VNGDQSEPGERSSDGNDELDALIQRADLDGLVRLVDNRTAAHDWEGLRMARDRCRAAVATGRQLWPAATLAEYRLALVAPPEWAAPMIAEDAGLFTIGPLTEVIAQHHTWSTLRPLLPATPGAAVAAHERVLRGEVPEPNAVAHLPDVFDLPYELAPWEPNYALATYNDDGVDAPPPPAPTSPTSQHATRSVERLDDPDVELAVRQLLETWTASSNGRAEVACVEGDADDAVSALGLSRWSSQPLMLAEALAWLGWAGASGGAHGRRRGAALGRFGALWVLAALLDLTEEWPVALDRLGIRAMSLRWSWWQPADSTGHGWQLRLAVADVEDGHGWAIDAADAV